MQDGHLVEQLSADDLRAGRTKHPHTTELRRLSTELEEAPASPVVSPLGGSSATR